MPVVNFTPEMTSVSPSFTLAEPSAFSLMPLIISTFLISSTFLPSQRLPSLSSATILSTLKSHKSEIISFHPHSRYCRILPLMRLSGARALSARHPTPSCTPAAIPFSSLRRQAAAKLFPLNSAGTLSAHPPRPARLPRPCSSQQVFCLRPCPPL